MYPDKLNSSFMTAFSRKEMKRVTAESTYSTEHFKNFLLKLINYNDWDTYIFMDNVSIHAVKKIVELCAKANLWIIKINPYSPFFNPKKKLILLLNLKLEKFR